MKGTIILSLLVIATLTGCIDEHDRRHRRPSTVIINNEQKRPDHRHGDHRGSGQHRGSDSRSGDRRR